MLANKEVYDITNNVVLNLKLLHGLMRVSNDLKTKKTEFSSWMALRRSSSYNRIAERIRESKFRYLDNIDIDRITRALSFSDCYWIKKESTKYRFENVSPYYDNAWNKKSEYTDGRAVPTLYVTGCIDKEWTAEGKLIKYGKLDIEIECAELCEQVGIECQKVHKVENGIEIENFTNKSRFLEQANMSGRINSKNFSSDDIVREFGLSGIQMIVIDAVVGNIDRHLGNFGWLRDVETGEYIKQSPLYDFDHALFFNGTEDCLIEDVVELIKKLKGEERDNIERLLSMVVYADTNKVFRDRADSILIHTVK